MADKQKNIPSFLWDYNLTKKEVKETLKNGNKYSRQILAARILEGAEYEDIWNYLTLKELTDIFLELPLKWEVKNAWEKAFSAWNINLKKPYEKYSYAATN